MEKIVFKTSEAAANHGGAMEPETISKNGASLKSHTSRGNFKYVMLAALLLVFSSCSIRIIDFTIISSKNHGLQFDMTKGIRVEGKSLGFLGLGVSIKGAVDNALENAGAGYDLLIDGVVSKEDYFFVAGFKVTGTAVSSRELRATLGEEGYLQWCEKNNIFDPNEAIVQK